MHGAYSRVPLLSINLMGWLLVKLEAYTYLHVRVHVPSLVYIGMGRLTVFLQAG